MTDWDLPVIHSDDPVVVVVLGDMVIPETGKVQHISLLQDTSKRRWISIRTEPRPLLFDYPIQLNGTPINEPPRCRQNRNQFSHMIGHVSSMGIPIKIESIISTWRQQCEGLCAFDDDIDVLIMVCEKFDSWGKEWGVPLWKEVMLRSSPIQRLMASGWHPKAPSAQSKPVTFTSIHTSGNRLLKLSFWC